MRKSSSGNLNADDIAYLRRAERELSQLEGAIRGTANWIDGRNIPWDIADKILTLIRLSIQYGKLLNTVEALRFRDGIEEETKGAYSKSNERDLYSGN
jgi:hypothetical protein